MPTKADELLARLRALREEIETLRRDLWKNRHAADAEKNRAELFTAEATGTAKTKN